jgi:probable rRNA maturation factor
MTAATYRRKSVTAVTSNVVVDVVIDSPKWRALPEAGDIVRRAIKVAAATAVAVAPAPAAATKRDRGGEVAVLLCDDATIAALNKQWRGQEGPTNVLSFPAVAPPVRGLQTMPLGDIAIAYETVGREAETQRKRLADHLAHLAIHGFLHLLGYDHLESEEAERMERLERDLLARIGIADPYVAGIIRQ